MAKKATEKTVKIERKIMGLSLVSGGLSYVVGTTRDVTLHKQGDKVVKDITVEGQVVTVAFGDGCKEEFHRSAVSLFYKEQVDAVQEIRTKKGAEKSLTGELEPKFIQSQVVLGG